MRVHCHAALAATVSLAALAAGAASAQEVTLDTITVTSTKTEESAIDALSGTSVVTRDDINRIQATSVAGAVRDVPGVTTSENNNDPSQSINIRGLQDFGRVNVLVDGARQNFQTTGHSANGRFFLDPEFIGGIDITRGPVSTIYGSGAIGGVVLFRTTTIDDILAADERYGVSQKIGVLTSGPGFFTSTAAGARIGTAADVFGQFVYRDVGRYRDGSGVTVPDTDRELVGGLGKFNLRPADGHTLSFSGQRQRYDFVNNGGTGTGTRFRHDVDTGTYTIGHRFQRPDMPWLDFSAKGYVTTTTDEQTVAEPTATFASLGVRPGSARTFDIETRGFDIFNTARFETGFVGHAVTAGIDAAEDDVKTTDRAGGFGTAFTPSGQRRLTGGFIQDELRFGGIFRVIGAARYDAYELEGGGFQSDGDRVSPKATLGVSPLRGIEFFGTYAEGYRAPAISETLINGIHPFPPFGIRPNPALRPEVAHTVEGGVNLKYDDVFAPGDSFRAKAVVFRNVVDDYIEIVSLPGSVPFRVSPNPRVPAIFLPDVQFQNITQAELTGTELEATYDWGGGFARVTATTIEGENVETGRTLVSVPPDRIGGTLAFRFLEQKLTIGARTWFVDEKRVPVDLAGVFPDAKSYGLVDAFASYKIDDFTRFDFVVENLLDKRYRKYLDSDYSPGLTAKIAATFRFASR